MANDAAAPRTLEQALRNLSSFVPGDFIRSIDRDDAQAAVDEIERLRARVAELGKKLDVHESYVVAVLRGGTFGDTPLAEREAIVAWLRTVYAQNRNARGFADAIEREEHYTRPDLNLLEGDTDE